MSDRVNVVVKDGPGGRAGSGSAGIGDEGPRRPRQIRRFSSLATPDAAGSVTPDTLFAYPGGKNGAGIWQRIISNMPPHDVYIEAFLGSGAVIRRKRPASEGDFGIDVDAGIIARHGEACDRGYKLVCADAVEWLGHRGICGPRTLIYADPPYLGSSRSWPTRDIYGHEMKAEGEHLRLLQLLTSLPAMVMISGYPHPVYEAALHTGWRRLEYDAMTRGGVKREVLWMNFPEPTELHDYRWLGEDFHDRLRIARKIARWRRKLAGLPALERAAVIAGIGLAADREETL